MVAAVVRFVVCVVTTCAPTTWALAGGFGAPAKVAKGGNKAGTTRAYSEKTLTRELANFQALASAGAAIHDVYIGARDRSKLFFVGKVAAAAADNDAADVVQRHRSLVIAHLRNLQPRFGPIVDKDLEVFVASGNTEVQVAKGQEPLRAATPLEASKAKTGETAFCAEIYAPGEDGFYVRRDSLV